MNQRRKLAPAALRSLAAGLLAFLLVESAVARHVSFALFVPVQAGVFLPGRLARLAACLAAGFALVLTEPGRSLGRAADRLCGRDRGRWLLAAAVTGLFFAWALRVIVPAYMTNDDPLFLQAIARIPTQGMDAVRNTLAHSAQESTSSISILLCALIGFFYRFWPDGYCYQCYHLFVLFLSMTVIGRCVLVKTGRRGWPAWTGCLIHGALCAGLFLGTLAQISFTVTPAVAGAAAAALMLCRHHETRRAGRVMSDVLSGGLMVLCCMQRRATGYCLLCFWALAVAYQLLRIRLDGEQWKKRLGGCCLAAAVTLALAVGVFAAGQLECDENYSQAEHYRSLVVDFLNDQITYDEYARAGIPQELAVLVHGWFFMDQRVTTDMFRAVSDNYYADLATGQTPSLPRQVIQTAGRMAASIGGDRQMLWPAACAAALLGLCLAAALRFGRRVWPELLCALCAVGGACLLLLYLAKDGRFLLRVFQVVAIPAVVTLLLAALSVPEGETPSDRRRPVAIWLGALCAGAAVLCCAGSVAAVPHATDTAVRADLFTGQWAIEQYASAHPDTTVYTSIYTEMFDPLHTPSDYPANRVLWGACGDTAKPASQRPYADVFFRDDVQFMTDKTATAVYLLQYLSMDWGPVQATVAARPAFGVLVCDIDRLSPGDDYTGWYAQNGMTYYFRDGQALTGEQLIDGERYTFAPAGGQGAPVSASAPGDMPIYTTTAYSLLSDG